MLTLVFPNSFHLPWTTSILHEPPLIFTSCSNSASFDIPDHQTPSICVFKCLLESLSLNPDPLWFSWGHLQLFSLINYFHYVVRTYHVYLWDMVELSLIFIFNARDKVPSNSICTLTNVVNIWLISMFLIIPLYNQCVTDTTIITTQAQTLWYLSITHRVIKSKCVNMEFKALCTLHLEFCSTAQLYCATCILILLICTASLCLFFLSTYKYNSPSVPPWRYCIRHDSA